MKKLKLDLDTLRVESFRTAEKADVRGTVLALEMTSCGEPCSCDCGSFGEPGLVQQQAMIG